MSEQLQERDARAREARERRRSTEEVAQTTEKTTAAVAETRERPAGRMDGGVAGGPPTPRFNPSDTQTFRTRWSEIQAGFVDEPRHSVEEADGLVAELMQSLAQTFSTEKNKLEGQWNRGEDVSTEDLRVALQRYRSFFDRLLSL